jgi:hypothetical protein
LGKIAEVFGKEVDIRPNDIQKIVDESVEESPTLEYKTFDRIDKLDDESKEKLIIRPLVAFLNAQQNLSSLLIFGIKTDQTTGHRPERVMPINSELLDEQRIRHIITNSIGAIPKLVNFPSLRIVSVPHPDNKFVHLVEITRGERAFFYSSISNSSYVRRANDSQQLTIEEMNALAQSWKVARLRLLPQEVSLNRLVEKAVLVFKVVVVNEGRAPASDVQFFLRVIVHDDRAREFTFNVRGTNSKKKKFKDLTSLNPKHFKTFSCRIRTNPIYPDFKLHVGRARVVFPTGSHLILIARFYDRDGTSTQHFMLDEKEKIKPLHSPKFKLYWTEE